MMKQVNEYQFPNPVPIQMRGVVMAELAAVRVLILLRFKSNKQTNKQLRGIYIIYSFTHLNI